MALADELKAEVKPQENGTPVSIVNQVVASTTKGIGSRNPWIRKVKPTMIDNPTEKFDDGSTLPEECETTLDYALERLTRFLLDFGVDLAKDTNQDRINDLLAKATTRAKDYSTKELLKKKQEAIAQMQALLADMPDAEKKNLLKQLTSAK